MEYEWDSNKAESNQKKHGIDFADAVFVFADDFAITVMDEHPDVDALARIIVVVYTWRSDSCIRLISARKATRKQRQHYELEE
jgi:uncharacterized protein